MKRSTLKEYSSWYLFLVIPILGTIIFNLYPIVTTALQSVQNMKGTFIGITNYEILFEDVLFIQSVKNTLYMTVLGVGFNIPIAFVIATMINNIPKCKNIYKVIFLLPMIMSMVTASLLFKYIFMPDQAGIANYVLSLFGIETQGFLNDPKMARETLIVMAIWKGIGYNIIVFFAGLQSVPRELYEAAEVDGANEWKQWLHITIPCVKNTFTFVIITSTISALKRFTEIYAVSGETGNPAGALNTIMLYIYKNSFSTLNYKDLGVASAASIVLFILILIITACNYFVTERGQGERIKIGRRKKIWKKQEEKEYQELM